MVVLIKLKKCDFFLFLYFSSLISRPFSPLLSLSLLSPFSHSLVLEFNLAMPQPKENLTSKKNSHRVEPQLPHYLNSHQSGTWNAHKRGTQNLYISLDTYYNHHSESSFCSLYHKQTWVLFSHSLSLWSSTIIMASEQVLSSSSCSSLM